MKADLIVEKNFREKRKRTTYTLYGIAAASYAISLIGIGNGLHPTVWSNIFTIACVVSLTLGFLIRIRPLATKLWNSVAGKLLLALTNAFAAVIASLPARHIVSAAIQLPAGDFPTTLTFWTILCYPAVAIGLTTAIFFFTYVLLLLVAALIGISTHHLIDGPIRWAAKLLPARWRIPEHLINGRSRLATVMLADASAAAILSVITAFSLTGWYHLVDQPNLVRIFAYVGDYETASDYPGVQKKEAFRLLENGVISYAQPTKWDVSIRVSCLDGLSCPRTHTSTP